MPGDRVHAVTVRDHPLAASLTRQELAVLLALGGEQTHPAGASLVTQGAPAPALHLLLDGVVEVVRRDAGGQHELAQVGGGGWVGESAVLGGVATADVRTLTDVRTFAVPASAGARLRALDAVHLQLDARARRRAASHRAVGAAPLIVPVGASGHRAGTVELRPVWPDDWRQLAAGRERVSQRSLEQRFFTVPPLTERTLRRFSTVDFGDQFAWAAFVDGTLGGIGRHALQAEDRGEAELAVLVADDLHRQGLGRLLVAAAVLAAARHGATHLSALARASNVGVHRLLARTGAAWSDPADGVVHARWAVADALPVARADLGPLADAVDDTARSVLQAVTDS